MEYPKKNEIIVCKITKIADYGVFASLLEYDGLEGFIHISQVSSSWIKNIHNHVKLNQIRAAKVLSIDEDKHHIDLSLNRVSNSDEKRKISDYRLFKRALGLLTVISKELNMTQDESWVEIGDLILEKESNLYNGFVNIVKYGVDYYPSIKSKYREKLFNLLSKNITIKDKVISTVLNISNNSSNGIDVVKKALTSVEKHYKNVDIIYLGPGKYSMKISAKDYKLASKDLKKVTELLSKSLKNSNFEVIKKNE